MLRGLAAAFLLVRAERHAELAQQRERFLVAVRARDERDVHPVDRLDRVVVDLGEDHLLLHAQRVIPSSIERLRPEPAEVADSRDRDRDEAIEELPHPRAAQRDGRADLLTLAQTEVGDRLLRLLTDRLLAGDDRQLLDDRVERLRLLDRFADADVDDDLLELRNLVRVLEAELLRQLLSDSAVVEVLEPRRRHGQSGAGVRTARLCLTTFLSAFAALLLFGCHSRVSFVILCSRSERRIYSTVARGRLATGLSH